MKIDLFKYIRGLKIKKHFWGTPTDVITGSDDQVEVSTNPISIQEVLSSHLLLSITDFDDPPTSFNDLLTDLEIKTNSTIDSGLKNKSKWTPTLPSGNTIDTFYKLVLEDINKYETKVSKHKHMKKDNLTREERIALKTLSDNQDLVIREADKGGNVVVMNVMDYNAEILSQLSDNSCYEAVDSNPMGPLTMLINNHLRDWKDAGLINDAEYLYLKVTRPSYPWLYTLPKIHKPALFPPGRPIVSGIGGPTERLSQYVDKFLNPMVKNMPSYIQDSKHILSILADIAWQPGLIMATLDVVSLYTSIEPDLGLAAVTRALNTRPITLLEHTKMLVTMMDIILNQNFIVFDKRWYKQTRGVAMGSRFSPSFANLYMGALEADMIWSIRGTKWIDYILYWGRYIDDCLLIWSGPETTLMDFCAYLNDNEMNMRFTTHISTSKVSFLDIELYVKNETLHSKLFRKTTACNSVLHSNSSHPIHQIYGIPYGEFMRARRNCSEEQEFETCIKDMQSRFSKRGYKPQIISKADKKIKKISRESTLTPKVPKIETQQPVRLITDYNELSPVLRKSFHKHWGILSADRTLTTVIGSHPQITFCRGRNLKNRLSPTVPKSTRTCDWLTQKSKGFFKCGMCSMCRWANHGIKSFSDHRSKLHTIKTNINCDTKFTVYIIECACKSRYVGSSIRALRERIREHARAYATKDPRYPMAIHMASCPSQGNIKSFTFYGIDVVQATVRGGNRELRLRRQEALWIMRLDTTRTGQNTDDELHFFLGPDT
ncbi:uncharacterized protein LOC144767356 [Lissotriton helveticus]